MTFRIWAPNASRVDLVLDSSRADMEREAGGWFASGASAPAGTRYAFSLDGGPPRPDPRSPWQPDGVHGMSATVDHGAFKWRDGSFTAPPLREWVIYELHVGTFTGKGTFEGVAEKLDHLVELGVTTVEIMPVAAFPGRWGWGYDGVCLYAPFEPYGGPDGLKRLVDACHRAGLAIILDVVYNHLGPDGNYLPEFGPYFTDRHHTPWGSAVNFAEAEVRRFVIDNALMWLRDYHFDGLRLDAVHAIVDDSPTHVLAELAREADGVLIAEHETVGRELLEWGIDGLWHDAVHHAVHVGLTGELDGYYKPFGEPSATAAAFASPYGEDPSRFVVCLQNHDQVGNRARGERISHLVGVEPATIGAAAVLQSPFVPLIFQGEEWAASTPFMYFTDHTDSRLAAAVSEGRRREFKAFGWKPDEVPDPQDEQTYRQSRLDWSEVDTRPHLDVLHLYRTLIAQRRFRTR